MCESLNQYCNRVKYLAYFGSFTRPEDYVPDISDINVVAISDDKSLLLEMASEGCSPIVLTENSLKDMCDKGDPICYYIMYDSRTVCGSLPAYIRFNFTQLTCERLRDSVIPLILNGIQSFFRYDELSTINNLYRALRALIRWRSCEVQKSIPLSDKDVIKACEGLSLSEICEKFRDISRLRKLKITITEWDINEVTDSLSGELGEKIPNIFEIKSKVNGIVKSIVRLEKGKYIVNTADGKTIQL
ncbi:MAG: hypothetical protein OWQ54_02440 [Sulfolobaceae archaeon]|nr:hypothetical protein [Sulfolobaceae archaeon]